MLNTGPFSSVRGSSEYRDSPRSTLHGWTRHGGVNERQAVGMFGENDYLPWVVGRVLLECGDSV